MRALWATGRTFAPIRVAHIVGGAVRVVVWVGSGSIYSNELAPVHLRHKAEDERNQCVLLTLQRDDECGCSCMPVVFVPFPMFLDSLGPLCAWSLSLCWHSSHLCISQSSHLRCLWLLQQRETGLNGFKEHFLVVLNCSAWRFTA